MFNKKISGHGTIKKLRTGAVISTLALSFMGGVVSADEVVTSSETTEVVTPNENAEVKEEVPVTSVGSSVVAEELPLFEVTPEVLAEASSRVTTQEGLVAEASSVVSATEAEVESTTNELSSIEGGIASVDSVTPAMVDEATKEAETAGMVYEEASSLVAGATKDVETVTSEVSKQEAIVNEAKTTLDKAESSLSDARLAVAELEKGTDITTLENNVVALEGRATASEGVVSKAQEAYDLEVTLEKDKEKALEVAKAGVVSADAKVSETATALSDAQTGEATALDALNLAKEELKNTPQYSEVPKLTIPQEFVNLLKRYFDEGKPEAISNQLADMGLDIMGRNGFVGFEKLPNHQFTYNLYDNIDDYNSKATEYERTHKVDMNNLSLEDRIHLTTFTAELINQIRDAFGSEHVLANLDAIDIANEVAKIAFEKHGHDKKANYSAAEPYGLVRKPDNVFVNGLSLTRENVGYYSNPIISLADTKEFVKQKILTMLLWDKHANWSHTFAITNYNTNEDTGQEKYLGTSYKSFGDYTGVFRMVTVSTQDLEDAKSNERTKDFNPNNNVLYANQNDRYNALKAKVDAAQTNYDKAKANVTKANQAYTDAKASQTEARNTLATLSNKVVDVEGALAKLNEAKANLDTTKAELTKAREVLALAKTGEAGRLEALNKAKEVETRADNAHTLAEGAYTRASGVLDTLKARLASTQATLDGILARVDETKANKMSAEAKVVSLTKALTDKEATLKELNVLKEATVKRLSDLKARLETEKLTVSERKVILDTLVSEYEGYKALAKAQADAKAEADAEVKVEEGTTTGTETSTTETAVGTTDNGTTSTEVGTTEVGTTGANTVVIEDVNAKSETTTTEATTTVDVVVPIHLVDKEKAESKQEQTPSSEEITKPVTSTPTYSRVAKQLPKTNSSNTSSPLTLLGTLLLALGITAYRRKEN